MYDSKQIHALENIGGKWKNRKTVEQKDCHNKLTLAQNTKNRLFYGFKEQ